MCQIKGIMAPSPTISYANFCQVKFQRYKELKYETLKDATLFTFSIKIYDETETLCRLWRLVVRGGWELPCHIHHYYYLLSVSLTSYWPVRIKPAFHLNWHDLRLTGRISFVFYGCIRLVLSQIRDFVVLESTDSRCHRTILWAILLWNFITTNEF